MAKKKPESVCNSCNDFGMGLGIVSAAPYLFHACLALVNALEMIGANGMDSEEESLREALIMAKEALDKASE